MSEQFGIEIDESVLSGFLEESKESLQTLDALFLELEINPENSQIVNSIFRPIHSIKGNAPFFGLMKLKTLAHELESLLAGVRDKKISITKDLIDLMLIAVDEIKLIFQRVAQKDVEVLDNIAFDELVNKIRVATNTQQEITPNLQTATPSSLPSTTEIKTSEQKIAQPSSTKTMRIAEERIDTFLGFVGELVIAQDMLRHFTDKVQDRIKDNDIVKDLSVINGVITTLGNELEKAIMSIRKVPIKGLLQKIPRLVRDVAKAKNKEINVQIEGDHIEIDKSLVELLDAPLIHMSRNSADHGIEMPAQREACGKNKTGQVTVSCVETASDITITISDDGAGLNYQALQKKAESLGIIQNGETLTEAQVVNLIFMAGVSTASEVSDISGRGVGMDVVKRNIESAGGTITVKSQAGLGSQFIITLPKAVTTQIIHGLLIKNSDIDIVVPLDKVREIWNYCDDQIIEVANQGICIRRNEEILPVLKLHNYLRTSKDDSKVGHQMMLTIDSNQSLVAVSIDQVVGMRQLVLKPLDMSLNADQIFLGGALLGDGNVALVLDVDKLN